MIKKDKNKPPLMLYVRSVLYWILLVVSSIITGSLLLIVFPLPLNLRYRPVTLYNQFNVWCLKYICGLKYKIHGEENIPLGAYIIMANHQSTWETHAVNAIFPRTLIWVIKRELLKLPFFGWGMASIEPIAIDRSAKQAAAEQLINQGKNRLDRGLPVVIFPEGTRVKVGERRRYKLGGARLASATGYPVIPMAHNAGLFWPRNSFVKWPGEISVYIGEPIISKEKTTEQVNSQVQGWIELKLQQMGILDK